jgi:mRNA interferase RelE/StbE
MFQSPSSASGKREGKADYRVLYPTKKHEAAVTSLLEGLRRAEQDSIMEAIEALAKNPRPSGCIQLKPPIPTLHYPAHYRIRRGDFRIFYDIRDDKRAVYILALRRRTEKTYRR